MRETHAKSGINSAYIWTAFSVLLVLASILVYTQFTGRSTPAPLPPSDDFEYDKLTQLAAAGDSEAMRRLGICFELGFNVPRSRQEALRYYTLSSEAGNVSARYQLANMLISSRGISSKDDEKGHQLLVDLATMGDESAQLSLVLYYRGKVDKAGNRTHLKEAYAWSNLLLGGMGTRKRSDTVTYLYSGSDYKTMSFEEIESHRGSIYATMGGEDEFILAEKQSFELFKTIKANKAKK